MLRVDGFPSRPGPLGYDGLDEEGWTTEVALVETSCVSPVELAWRMVEVALIVRFARRALVTLPELRWARRKDALQARVIADDLKRRAELKRHPQWN